jgi:hypothetical protein
MSTDTSDDGIPDQFSEVTRHWDPYSEPFTGCDTLFAALQNGWQLYGAVFCREFWYSGNRQNFVFYFRLKAGANLRRMAVIGSPHVFNFIRQGQLQVMVIKDTEPVPIPVKVARQYPAKSR